MHTRRLWIAWGGQLVSSLGTSITAYAISIWVFESTGQAVMSALLLLVRFMPMLLLSPLAGVLIDQRSKISTLFWVEVVLLALNIPLGLLFFSGISGVGWLFVILGIIGCLSAFRFLIYDSSISLLIQQNQYARANGAITLLNSLPMLASPLVAVWALNVYGIFGIVIANIASYVVALAGLLALPFDKPTRNNMKSRLHLSEGFRWILKRRYFRGLQWIFSTANFFNGLGLALLTPYLLTITEDRRVLAHVSIAGACGAVLGGVFVTILRDVHHKTIGMILTLVGGALLGRVLFSYAPSFPGITVLIWIGALFGRQLLVPFTNSWNQAIWQQKVPQGIQGRVFGARKLLGQGAYPLGLIAAGLLSDYLFEPLFNTASRGRGMGLLMLTAGLGEIVCTLFGYWLMRQAKPVTDAVGIQLDASTNR